MDISDIFSPFKMSKSGGGYEVKEMPNCKICGKNTKPKLPVEWLFLANGEALCDKCKNNK